MKYKSIPFAAPRFFLVLFFCALFTQVNGQFFANQLVAHGPCDPTIPLLCPAGVTDPEAAVDSDGSNFALLHSELGLLPAAFLEIAYSKPAQPLSYQTVLLSEPNQVLTAEALQGLTISFLTDDDSVIYSLNGLSLQDVQALSGNGDIYAINSVAPSGNYELSKVRFEWGGLLNVFGSIAIHGAFYVDPDTYSTNPGCLPDIANNLISSQNCLAPNNLVDTDFNSYGIFTLPVGVLTNASAHVSFDDAKATDFIAFEVGANNVVLGLGLLQNLTIEVFDEVGNLVATKSDFELADLIAVSEIGPKFWVGVQTPDGNYTPSSARLTMEPGVGVLYDLRVYGAVAANFLTRVNVTATSTVICEGETSTLTAEEGYLNYQWSTGISGRELTVANAGLYTVSATTNTGCIVNGLFIVRSGNLESDLETTNSTCGLADGSASLNLQGGSGAYIVAWEDGSNQKERTGLAAGIYSVNVTDSLYGCSETMQVNISDTLGPSILGTTKSSSCSNPTGQIFLEVSGEAPFTFEWNDGAVSEDRTGLAPGEYLVQITDFNGCKTVERFIIDVDLETTVEADLRNPDCNQSNGSIILNVAGGPFNYIWSNGSTDKDQFNLASGAYSVRISLPSGDCFEERKYSLSDKGIIEPALERLSNESCFGDDGLIEIEPIPGYEALWSNGTIGWDLSDVPAGDYVLEYGPSNDDCIGFKNFRVEDYRKPEVSIRVTNDCIQSPEQTEGAIFVELADGSQQNSILWDNGDTTFAILNLLPGEYVATITEPSGCTSQISARVEQTDCFETCPISFNNFISPNNDGVNDVWVIENLEECPSNRLSIYDRWGATVYEANNYQNNWNALNPQNNKPLPEGVYYYVLETTEYNGASYTGSINILR